MKDINDKKTKDFLSDKPTLLKSKDSDFQRLHIEKLVRGGKKKTTISIETLSYELLSLKFGLMPHTREANEYIKSWILEKMEQGMSGKYGDYDIDAPYYFSKWLKKTILRELISEELSEKWLDFMDIKARQ